jgi:hypothetical protein
VEIGQCTYKNIEAAPFGYQLPTVAASVQSKFNMAGDLWHKNWHSGWFFTIAAGSPVNSYLTNCFIFFNHPVIIAVFANVDIVFR